MNGSAAVTGGPASCRFAHYFVVCGVDTETGLEPDDGAGESFEQSPIRRSFKSKVLVHHPESTDRHPFNKDAINMLCMPRGLSFCTQAERLDPRFHSFTIAFDDGTRSYGFVHTFYEEVTSPQIITAMQTLCQMHHVEHHSSSSPSSSSSSSASSPSTCSMDSLASSLEESDAESLPGAPGCLGCVGTFDPTRDTLYVSKALCLITPLPFLQASQRFLAQLHQAVTSQTAPPLPLESYIHNILYEVPLPPPGRSLRFHGVQGPIVCQRPGPGELPLADYPLGEAFSLLGVENMVKLLTCVLLETQVLLCSQDYQRLMTVAEGITTLLFPFQWQHIYLPIISGPLHHLLHAPVPFLMGIQRKDGAQRSSLHLPHEANLCFVDIDKHCVEYPEDIPQFPDQTELIQELNEVLLRFDHPAQVGLTTKPSASPDSNSPRLSSLVLEDLMEDRQNGNLGGEELEVLERLQALARRCGGEKGSEGGKTLGLAFEEEEEELKAAKLNVQLREVFAARFTAMFGRYEEFVIHGALDLESWLNNREGTFSFDKGSFLAVQPAAHRNFLSRFLETSMFSSFVDGKVISCWADREPLQQLFDSRLQRGRLHETKDEDSLSRLYGKCGTLLQSAQAVERRLLKVDHMAIHPHLLDMRIGQGRHHPGYFPKLQADVLEQAQNTNKRSSRVTVSRRSESRKPAAADHSGADNEQRQKHIFLRRNLHQSRLLDPSPQAVTHTHREFVDGLLNECRLKTKRMLMERMEKENVELGHGGASISGLQENTLIYGLCDLLERTWGHGLQMKQGKSALWSHLVHHQAAQGKMEAPAESPDDVIHQSPNNLEPQHLKMLLSCLQSGTDSSDRCRILLTLGNAAAFTVNQILIREFDGIHIIAAFLTDPAPEVKIQTLNALNNLCMNIQNQEQIKIFVPRVLELIEMSPVNSDLQLGALRLLTNLSVTDKHQHLLKGAVTLLLSLLVVSNESLQVQTLKVLVNLSSNPDMIDDIVQAQAPASVMLLFDKRTAPAVLLRLLTFVGNLKAWRPSAQVAEELRRKQDGLFRVMLDESSQLHSRLMQLLSHPDAEIQAQVARIMT